MIISEIQHLYIQLIMKKLFLETKGETTCTAFCNPFKMRVHIQGILGDLYNSEQYHEALELIVYLRLARFGGMYITQKGVQYVERLTILENNGLILSPELKILTSQVSGEKH